VDQTLTHCWYSNIGYKVKRKKLQYKKRRRRRRRCRGCCPLPCLRNTTLVATCITIVSLASPCSSLPFPSITIIFHRTITKLRTLALFFHGPWISSATPNALSINPTILCMLFNPRLSLSMPRIGSFGELLKFSLSILGIFLLFLFQCTHPLHAFKP
jgi:hypothetical protein